MDSPPAQLYTDDSVYLGVWTNWSRGRIRGATLTLSRRNGGLLTAFLALFVTLVGARFWRIGCFFIHRYFASEHARDALCHQRQAILRNAADSTSSHWDLLRACWAWRQYGLAPYRSLLPSTLFAILTFMAFAVVRIVRRSLYKCSIRISFPDSVKSYNESCKWNYFSNKSVAWRSSVPNLSTQPYRISQSMPTRSEDFIGLAVWN